MIPEPLHPAVVHFPIVLAMLAPFFALGALWAMRRGVATRKAWGLATAVLAALSLSAWVAVQTGEQQEDRVEDVVAHAPFESHEESAEAFLLMSAGVLGIAVLGFVGGPVGRVARIAATAGAVVLVAGVARVGYSGGELVYRYGAASAYTQTPVGQASSDDAPATGDDDRRDERRNRRGEGDGR
jgi:uncharacterized membrane protein